MVERHVFRKKTDTAAGTSVTERLIQQNAGAARWPHETHREVDRCRLSSPVRTKESEDLPGFNSQIEVLQGADCPPTPERFVALADTRELEDDGQNTIVFTSCQLQRKSQACDDACAPEPQNSFGYELCCGKWSLGLPRGVAGFLAVENQSLRCRRLSI